MAQSKASNADEGEIFAFVFNWPNNGKLMIKGLDAGELKASTYDGRPLTVSVTKVGLEVDLSSAKAEPQATVLRIQYCGGRVVATSASGVDLGLKGDELSLDAKDAKLSGKFNRLQNNEYIGFWTDESDTASWTLNVPAPGKYAVKLFYSCAESYAGSTAKLTVGGKSLTAKVSATKGWEDFELMDMGVIDLKQVGTTKCTIGFGEKKGKALFNLKLVLFVSIED